MELLCPVKLKNILPIKDTGGIITPEIVDYMSLYLEPTTILDSETLKVGPPSIESEYDEALAAPDIIRIAREAELDGYHGIFINCFGDPGLRAVRECVNIPVFGGFEPPILFALGLCDKVGVVTVVKNVLSMLDNNVSKARLNDRVVSLRSVGIPVADLSNIEKVVPAILDECREAIEKEGVQGFVLGCTAMVSVAERVKAALLEEGYDVPVMEAAQAALKLLEVYAQMNLRHSRITYMTPPHLPE